MKKFISTFLIFIFLTTGVYFLLILAWGNFAPKLLKKNLNYERGSYGHLYTRAKEAKQTHDVDILFIGSSRSYRGFDTRLFEQAGYKTFNLGSSIQTPLQTELLLDRYLDQLNPKIVFYEVYPLIFSSDGVESSLDLIANEEIDWDIINMSLRQNNIKVYNTLIYGLIKDALNDRNSYVEPVAKDDDIYIKGGYVGKDRSRLPNFKTKDYTSIQFNKEQLACFERIADKLKKKNISLIAVQAPTVQNVYASYPSNNIFDSTISTHVHYINFNEFMFLEDSTYFYDAYHLNQKGVELFNKRLMDTLQLHQLK